MVKKFVNNKKVLSFIVIVLIACFLYFGGRETFTAYESLIFGNSSVSTSDIKVRLNGVDIASNSEIFGSDFFMNNIKWNSTHTREGKISPGSSGTFQLELDPTGSEVAILYEFSFVDKTIDSSKLLTFERITMDDEEIIKTAQDTYSGVISLDEISNGKKIKFNIDFTFDNSEDIEGIDDGADVYEDLFEINFNAIQYRGEELVPYIG